MVVTRIANWARWLKRHIELFPFLFSPSHFPGHELVVVTAADSTHFKSLCALLSSVLRHEPAATVIAYDLGLTDAEVDHLRSSFTTVDFRSFDYSRYPEYFNIKNQQGQYAWKPVIFWEVMDELKGVVCWMDAGNLVTRRLSWLRRIVNQRGFYAACSPGRIGDWTHENTLQYLKVSASETRRYNLSAGLVCANYQHSNARRTMKKWRACALAKDCIAPAGSSRANHRQDQAVLSVLAHQSGIIRRMPKGRYGFKIQQDID